MNFIFICSSFEPGKDGVGDYTRRLVGELIRQGHLVSIVALHDKHIDNIQQEVQIDQNSEIDTLRLPSCISWNKRIEIAKEYVDEFKPDWLSLQYVPFGFHDKGLPFLLGIRLKKIAQGRKWHIMFHELWVGMEKNASFKVMLWGYIQSIILKNTYKTLKPSKVHTQTKIYQACLKKLSINANYLPLFSNIPVVDAYLSNYEPPSMLNIVVFGSIHSGSQIKEFISELIISNNICNFIFIGRNGIHLNEWVNVLQENSLTYVVYGELPSDQISKLLLRSCIGVTTTPFYLTEKSGTVAAMIEHGMPVICIRNNWEPRCFDNNISDSNVVLYNKGSLDAQLKNIRRGPFKINILYNSMNSFLSDLNEK